MKQVIVYLLQVILVSGILYGYYHFFLRNRQFHQYNRFYLLASVVISLLVPLLDISVYFDNGADIPAIYQVLAEVRVGTTIKLQAASNSLFTWNNLLTSIYIIIAAVLLLRMIIAIFRIVRLFSTSSVQQIENISFVNTSEKGTPYSFFSWLFWNNDIPLSTDKGQQMFRHEMYHIRQKHSWDIVALEIISLLLWVNPFFHVIRKEIRTIHEFLADRYAINGDEKFGYAELLLMEAFQTRQRFVHPFFHNQIKRRIAMILHSPNKQSQYFRKLMVLPIGALLVSLTVVNCTTKDKVDPKPQEIVIEEVPAAERPAEKVVDSSIMAHIKDLKQEIVEVEADKVFAKVEIEAAFPGGVNAWRKFLKENLNANAPIDNGAPAGVYTIFVQFIVDKQGNISDLKTLSNHGYGMEKEVLRVMKLSPLWAPAIQNGRTVKAYRTQPVTFSVTEE